MREAAIILSRALRDPAAPMGASPSGGAATSLTAAAVHHRVLLLLGWTLRAAGTLSDWPPEFIAGFKQAEHGAVPIDCVRQVELTHVLDGLAAAGVRAMVFKGAALACTHYPASYLRVREDTDVLVEASDMPALAVALGGLGYVQLPENSGRLVFYQSHYERVDRYGVSHALDVHWKISNLQTLAECFSFEELWGARVRLPALGASAVTTNQAHALLLALLHRAGHHPGSSDLLWIYDLHLLASRMTREEMRQAQELAGARRLSRIAADGLALARRVFGTATVDDAVHELLGQAAHEEGAEVVRGSWSQADILRVDLGALRTWRARGQLLREHLLPPASYMRARYGVRSNVWLPGLYLWRALAGAPKWLRQHQAED